MTWVAEICEAYQKQIIFAFIFTPIATGFSYFFYQWWLTEKMTRDRFRRESYVRKGHTEAREGA